MAKFRVDLLRSPVTNLRDRGLAFSRLTKGALNKYLILCLVLVQPHFKINEALNIIIIIVCVLWALNRDVWVMLGSH